MYSTNSSRMEYYRQRNEQQDDSYDDDFKGFTKEVEGKKDDFLKEEKKNNRLFNFLFRKASNGHLE